MVQQHLSAGASWSLSNGKEVNIAYQHAFAATVNGADSIPASFGGGEAVLRMYQNPVGVGFGWGK